VAASLKRQNSLAEVGDALIPLPDYYALVGLQATMEREESCDRAAPPFWGSDIRQAGAPVIEGAMACANQQRDRREPTAPVGSPRHRPRQSERGRTSVAKSPRWWKIGSGRLH
jgi:hypothetical protein